MPKIYQTNCSSVVKSKTTLPLCSKLQNPAKPAKTYNPNKDMEIKPILIYGRSLLSMRHIVRWRKTSIILIIFGNHIVCSVLQFTFYTRQSQTRQTGYGRHVGGIFVELIHSKTKAPLLFAPFACLGSQADWGYMCGQAFPKPAFNPEDVLKATVGWLDGGLNVTVQVQIGVNHFLAWFVTFKWIY